jgi:replicative DNA helicase
VLGSILLDDTLYVQAAGTLEADDFSLEKHRRIFKRMGELQERGEKIDRITVANELMKFNELEACDGLSYLVSNWTTGCRRFPISTATYGSSRTTPCCGASSSLRST